MTRALVRCFIFGVFGPCLGLLAFVIFGRGSAKDLSSDTFVIVLLLVYLNGLVPALITAAFDSYLDRRVKGISKWSLAGSFGYVAAYVNVLVPLLVYQPLWGLVGAIPAIICSAITDQVIGSTKECARA
jgi:mannitol-specific phosphotransferase system IIBC component